MDDLISRQDVIKAVLGSNFSACTVYGRSEEGMATAKELIQAIKNLPSAQPEIVRCKDCKYAVNVGTVDMMCKNVNGWVVATENDFGCVLAERKDGEQS